MKIQIKVLVLSTMLADGLLHASLASRRMLGQLGSAAAKALPTGSTARSRVPIVPATWRSSRPFGTAPVNTALTVYAAPKNTALTIPKSFESSDQQSQRFTWRRFGRGVAGGCIVLAGLNKAVDDSVARIEMTDTDDLAVVDPEAYEAALHIVKDYGIKENISFRVVHANSKFFTGYNDDPGKMSYNPTTNTVFISPHYKLMPKSYFIRAIAHELEHHRQFHKYPGSFHTNSLSALINKNDTRRKIETAAEAASLDYQHCQDCLREQWVLSNHRYEPKETAHGYFTSQTGYATKPDIALYYHRALDERLDYCRAHKRYSSREYLDRLPYKDFLPTTKPSLPGTKYMMSK